MSGGSSPRSCPISSNRRTNERVSWTAISTWSCTVLPASSFGSCAR